MAVENEEGDDNSNYCWFLGNCNWRQQKKYKGYWNGVHCRNVTKETLLVEITNDK